MASRRTPPLVVLMRERYNIDQIRELVEEIKKFDAGAVDFFDRTCRRSIFCMDHKAGRSNKPSDSKPN